MGNWLYFILVFPLAQVWALPGENITCAKTRQRQAQQIEDNRREIKEELDWLIGYDASFLENPLTQDPISAKQDHERLKVNVEQAERALNELIHALKEVVLSAWGGSITTRAQIQEMENNIIETVREQIEHNVLPQGWQGMIGGNHENNRRE